eukprot:CAMPEP_0115704346 /NCGR_PEP_ID=MMETSP0272-20121206/69608_1 /TAXON_ID=71861 /ORGANISM="Scrippsiella trochoidea, Strain CCMP3099" /LENGTH=216 /DNA_ID=CAMNT_0003145321 /DNA_START=1 /DNA_END=648 /DNA_ORIENTATION=-
MESAPDIEAMLREGGEEGPAAFRDVGRLSWGHKALRDSGLAGEPPGVCVLDDELFDQVSEQEQSQGVICVFALPPQSGATSWATGRRAVVLDGVRNSLNIGVIMRTMEAFEATTLVTVKGTMARGSMGAIVRGDLQILSAGDADELKSMLRGYKIFATALEGEVGTSDLHSHMTGKDAFVFGHEGLGVSQSVLEVADARLRIPMSPQVNSLNVGVS